MKKNILASLAVLAVLTTGIFSYHSINQKSLWDRNAWQAIFLDNNQVYFGKIQKITSKNIYLTNIYYLQAGQSLENKDTASTVNLVKLGSELHGPTDEMIINREKVIFWENLKETSRIVKIISNY